MTLYRTIAYIETFVVPDNPIETFVVPGNPTNTHPESLRTKCNLSNLFALFKCTHLKQSIAVAVDICYAESNT
jgi:hypothetical protein